MDGFVFANKQSGVSWDYKFDQEESTDAANDKSLFFNPWPESRSICIDQTVKVLNSI